MVTNQPHLVPDQHGVNLFRHGAGGGGAHVGAGALPA